MQRAMAEVDVDPTGGAVLAPKKAEQALAAARPTTAEAPVTTATVFLIRRPSFATWAPVARHSSILDNPRLPGAIPLADVTARKRERDDQQPGDDRAPVPGDGGAVEDPSGHGDPRPEQDVQKS